MTLEEKIIECIKDSEYISEVQRDMILRIEELLRTEKECDRLIALTDKFVQEYKS